MTYKYGNLVAGSWRDTQESFATFNPARPAQQVGRYSLAMKRSQGKRLRQRCSRSGNGRACPLRSVARCSRAISIASSRVRKISRRQSPRSRARHWPKAEAKS